MCVGVGVANAEWGVGGCGVHRQVPRLEGRLQGLGGGGRGEDEHV